MPLPLAPNTVVNETPAATTPDTAFRWDATAQQWILNLSTQGLNGGTRYFYQIGFKDGTTLDFSLALK